MAKRNKNQTKDKQISRRPLTPALSLSMDPFRVSIENSYPTAIHLRHRSEREDVIILCGAR